MPKSQRPPAYRLHKARKSAVVTIDGKNHYLGPFGSPESHEKYARVIAEWRLHAKHLLPTTGPRRADPTLSVNELILGYFRHAQAYYVKDGRPTSEQDNIRQALRFVRQLYGASPAVGFGPVALKNVRQAMIEAGRSRRLINKDIHRVRGMFKWAAGQELFPGEALAALGAVAGLEKGRSGANERPPVQPVTNEAVEATLPHLSPQVAAMVRLQLLTAARPGEVCAIRPRDVDRSQPVWLYRPGSHKTEHRGRERVIALGPRAQGVLSPWLDRPADFFCFRPEEAARLARRTGRGRFGDKYTRHSYKLAIARACDRAFPHPTIDKVRGVELVDGQAADLAAWRKAHRWHPHQLRHTRATEIRRRFDVEAAQVILGHSKPDTTLVYAERDLVKAMEVMREIG